LLPDFPFPASTGGKLKVFNILKYMSLSHQCDILCFGKFDEIQAMSFHLELPGVNILEVMPPPTILKKRLFGILNLLRLLPPSFAAFFSYQYLNALRRILADNTYDVIHYDIINMAQYRVYGRAFASVHSPNDATSLVYFDTAKDLNVGVRKIHSLVSAALLKRFEKKNYQRFSKVHVVSLPDAKYLLRLNADIDTAVIPISTGQSSVNSSCKGQILDGASTKSLRVVCTGSFENHSIAAPIYDFVRTVWPRVKRSVPNAELVILGKNIPPHMLLLFRSSPDTEVLTWVDDYQAFLSTADVVLVPDRVGPNGAKTRTLEAMGLKLAVLGTQTAFAGMPFIDQQHGFLYKSLDECAEAMVNLLEDSVMRRRLAAGGHQLAIENFSLDVIGPQYEQLYRDATIKFNSAQLAQGI
jgi:polysaccharide biosynthesis protein PslH